MKKYYYLLVPLALAAVVLAPSATLAEEDEESPSASPSASASSSASPSPYQIREKIRAEVESKNQSKSDKRNDILERKRMATSSASTTDKMIRKDLKNLKGDIKDVREDFRDNVKDIRKDAKEEAKDFIKENRASTTMSKKEVRREIEAKLFQTHKEMLVKQLNLAIDNLKQIRERIVSRITKAEQNGKNMTEAKELLATADAKISAAQTAITALANFQVTATTTASTTTTVKLDKPREIGDKAIKATREARDALRKVIVSVARHTGTTTVTATTTATTTTQ